MTTPPRPSDETRDRLAEIRWPDGQIRPEEPYQCGAFRVGDDAQCVLYSDHRWGHVFPNEVARMERGEPVAWLVRFRGTKQGYAFERKEHEALARSYVERRPDELELVPLYAESSHV